MGETIKISPTSVNAKRWGYVETKDADESEISMGKKEPFRSFYSASLGSRIFNKMATMAAGTMPEPPKIS